MSHVWRVVDTGVRRAAENLALNRAMLEAREQGESPSTLRFLRFRPCALLGYHQSAEQELDLDYCRSHGIEIQRRITGGGAIYFDEGQLGWELYLTREDVGTADMQAIARRICEAAARGISELGVDARFRPRNDIEVNGRKISGTGGAFDGSALMYQGTLLVEFDVERMLRVLRIPAEKLSDKAIESARSRVTTLAELLGAAPDLARARAAIEQAFAREFGVEFRAGDLNAAERLRLDRALREMDHPDWVGLIARPASEKPILAAQRKFAGGLLRVALSHDRAAGRIHQVWFTGDMFVNPARSIADLEARLRDVPVPALADVIERFFAEHRVDMLSLAPADFIAVVHDALAQAPQPTASDP